MKYVKVLSYNEYSVFEVIGENEKFIQCKLNNCENGYILIDKNNIIKQADTIEELCDRFVYNRIGEYEVYRNIETDFKENDINYIKRGGSITGAIWTDKGLIYIAKMNEEGELVLI